MLEPLTTSVGMLNANKNKRFPRGMTVILMDADCLVDIHMLVGGAPRVTIMLLLGAFV
jgi:hypothetical protein